MVVYDTSKKYSDFSILLWGHLSGIILTAIAICTGLAPNVLAFLVFVYIISLVIFTIHSGETISSISDNNKLILILFSLCAYLFMNSLWAVDTGSALKKAAYVTCAIILLSIFLNLIKQIPDYLIARHAFCLILGGGGALIYLLTEIVTSQSLMKEGFGIFPWLMGNESKAVVSNNGEIEEIVRYALNKNIGALNMVLWPLILISFLWLEERWRWTAVYIIFGAMAFITFVSDSDTAKVGLVLSMIVFYGAFYLPKEIIYKTFITAWILIVVFSIPIMSLPYKMGVHKLEWLPFSARDRVGIWSYTAEKIPENLLFGIGIRSTRFKQDEWRKKNPVMKKLVVYRRPGWHSHNLFLQIWYELGLFGAAFLLFIGLQVLSAIRSLTSKLQPIGYASFVMAGTILSFGWGVWQSWLIASLLLCCVTFLIAKEFSMRKNRSLRLDL